MIPPTLRKRDRQDDEYAGHHFGRSPRRPRSEGFSPQPNHAVIPIHPPFGVVPMCRPADVDLHLSDAISVQNLPQTRWNCQMQLHSILTLPPQESDIGPSLFISGSDNNDSDTSILQRPVQSACVDKAYSPGTGFITPGQVKSSIWGFREFASRRSEVESVSLSPVSHSSLESPTESPGASQFSGSPTPFQPGEL